MIGKKGQKISSLLFLVVIIGMFSAAMVAVVSDLDSRYDLDLDTSQFATFNQINKTNAQVGLAVQEDFQNATGEFSAESFTGEAPLKAAFKSLKLFFTIPGTLIAMSIDGFNILTGQFGIDSAFLAGLITIITLVIAVGVVSLVMRKDA